MKTLHGPQPKVKSVSGAVPQPPRAPHRYDYFAPARSSPGGPLGSDATLRDLARPCLRGARCPTVRRSHRPSRDSPGSPAGRAPAAGQVGHRRAAPVRRPPRRRPHGRRTARRRAHRGRRDDRQPPAAELPRGPRRLPPAARPRRTPRALRHRPDRGLRRARLRLARGRTTAHDGGRAAAARARRHRLAQPRTDRRRPGPALAGGGARGPQVAARPRRAGGGRGPTGADRGGRARTDWRCCGTP